MPRCSEIIPLVFQLRLRTESVAVRTWRGLLAVASLVGASHLFLPVTADSRFFKAAVR